MLIVPQVRCRRARIRGEKATLMVKKRLRFILIAVLIIATISLTACAKSGSGEEIATTPISLEEALVSGKPTLAEFGSTSCVYCLQMKAILEEIAKDYQGKLNILIINVYEEGALVQKYGIIAIPTQIFFDRSGNIVTKHLGLLPKEDVTAQLKKMGIE